MDGWMDGWICWMAASMPQHPPCTAHMAKSNAPNPKPAGLHALLVKLVTHQLLGFRG